MGKHGYGGIQNFFLSTFYQQVLPCLAQSSFIFIKHIKRLLENSANLSVVYTEQFAAGSSKTWSVTSSGYRCSFSENAVDATQSAPRMLCYLFCIPTQNSCLVGRQKQHYCLNTNDLKADLKFSLRRVGPQACYIAALEQQCSLALSCI